MYPMDACHSMYVLPTASMTTCAVAAIFTIPIGSAMYFAVTYACVIIYIVAIIRAGSAVCFGFAIDVATIIL